MFLGKSLLKFVVRRLVTAKQIVMHDGVCTCKHTLVDMHTYTHTEPDTHVSTHVQLAKHTTHAPV